MVAIPTRAQIASRLKLGRTSIAWVLGVQHAPKYDANFVSQLAFSSQLYQSSQRAAELGVQPVQHETSARRNKRLGLAKTVQ